MKMKRYNLCLAGCVCLLGGFGSADAYVISVLPNTNYNADPAVMDANLGIGGLTIEGFEDVDLTAGLTIEHKNPDAGPTGTLGQVYMDGSGSFSNNAWDGGHALVSTFDNDIWHGGPSGTVEEKASESVTFHLAGGVDVFGVGLGNFQAEEVDHAIFINGVEALAVLESQTGFVSGINVRNGYLLIEAEAGESISSVKFQLHANGTSTPVTGAAGDGLIFDHLAFGSVPEPGVLGVLGMCLGGLGLCRGRLRG